MNHDQSAEGPVWIYKILPGREWEAAQMKGAFEGSGIDLQDGFIHFSNAAQVAETAARHFAGMSDLLLVAIDANQLGGQLKWERSRGGDLFPHLYRELRLEEVHSVTPMPLEPTGSHRIQLLPE